jgi:hypothetical protein
MRVVWVGPKPQGYRMTGCVNGDGKGAAEEIMIPESRENELRMRNNDSP